MEKLKVKSEKLKEKMGFARTLIVALFRFWKAVICGGKDFKKKLDIVIRHGETKKAAPHLVSGFVALFAVLISSIVLTISFGLLNIALKEVILSSSGRESQFGFYAADAGTECALYWDIKGLGGGLSAFPTSTDSTIPPSGIICNGQDITTVRTIGINTFNAWSYSVTPSAATTTFWLSIVSGKSCSRVDVAKYGNSTKIDSYGYNTCNFSDPRVIERGIRVTY